MAKVKKNEGKISKTGAVREALEQGVTDNSKIIAFAKEKHGIDILPKHLSVIKSSIKKQGVATGNGRRKPKVNKEAEAGTSVPLRRLAGTWLKPCAVADLGKMVGGIDQLRQLVDVLASVR